MGERPPLILFSGMGADERVFAPQVEALGNVIVPKWLPPRPDETLCAYGQRLAEAVDPGRPFFIGGASFGGMVAIEAARRLPGVLGCFLIGSVRSPDELPRRLRVMRPATRVARRLPFGWLPPAVRCVDAVAGGFCSPATRAFLRQAAGADAEFLRWACGALLTWEAPRGPPPFPVHQIHGERDAILPWRLTRPDALVRGGGHVLSLSHPRQVNAFLRERMATAGPASPPSAPAA